MSSRRRPNAAESDDAKSAVAASSATVAAESGELGGHCDRKVVFSAKGLAGTARSGSPQIMSEKLSRIRCNYLIIQGINDLDWAAVAARLDSQGCAVLPGLLPAGTCRELAGLYPDDSRFRSRVVMSRHGFGRGEYKYFTYPLPPAVAELRSALYPHLAPIANEWRRRLGSDVRYPPRLETFLADCHAAGQVKPTPLLLQYGQEDYNCLHQDLYGEWVFPLQLTVLLSQPDRDFTGGEFVLTEQRPRMQSRAEVVPLGQGDGVVFAVHHRPVRGTRGDYRVNLRHGVSRVRSGRRHTLGVIFHDAK